MGFIDRFFIAPTHLFWLDAVEQRLKASPVCFAAGHIGPVANRPALLKALGPDAQLGPVEIQDLYLRGAPVDERKQIARQWVLQHDVPGQRVQAVERQAHAHRMAVQEDAHLALGEEHQRLAIVSATPSPRSMRRSMPDMAGDSWIGVDADDCSGAILAVALLTAVSSGCKLIHSSD
nr:hypothetical protein [Massilia mucilaginosa]